MSSRTNNSKRRILPLFVILLACRRGCVIGHSIIAEEEDPPLDYSRRMDDANGEHADHSIPGHQGEIIRNESPPMDLPPVLLHPQGEEDATIHKVSSSSIIHTDYIHEVTAAGGENEVEPATKVHSPQHHSVDDSHQDISDPDAEQQILDSMARQQDEPEDTSVPTFTIEQLRTLLQTLEGEQQTVEPLQTINNKKKNNNNNNNNNNRSWKSSDLVDDDNDEVVRSKTMEDDRTLLDVFGEAAKQFLTQKVVRSHSSSSFESMVSRTSPTDFILYPTLDTRNQPRMQMGLAITEL